MSSSESQKDIKKALRVVLDEDATNAFFKMTEEMKLNNPCIKVSPSAFVSFLVRDFSETYFKKDIEIFISEFFDSKKYYNEQMKRVSSKENFESVMKNTLSTLKKIHSKRRRKEDPTRAGLPGSGKHLG